MFTYLKPHRKGNVSKKCVANLEVEYEDLYSGWTGGWVTKMVSRYFVCFFRV